MKNSITLNFAQLDDLKERIDLCDTVKIYFEALGITATAKCVSATWDVIAERYTSNTFGEAVSSIADTIATVQDRIKGVPTKTEIDDTINHQTELITGNLGGYVVFHDSDLDGKPDEILIMDTDDIGTASKVWRWNQNGLGYSDTGYSGTFSTAITSDGYIVCDFLKTGKISDVQGHSEIDMNTGIAKLFELQALGGFKVLTEGDGDVRAEFYNNLRYTSLTLSSSDVDAPKAVLGGYASSYGYGGQLALSYDGTMSPPTAILQAESDGGILQLRNQVNKAVICKLGVGAGYKDGILYLKDESGTDMIWGLGHTGELSAVTVTQRSSRKIKDNIHPIEDSMKILDLQAVSFDFKNKDLGTNQRGFIAEDVSEVLPNLVSPETKDHPASLNYVGMIPYLQDVIKKQEERIKVLEEKITKLGG